MKFHPLADVFPLIEGEEFEKLVEDVSANGLLEPIIVHDGQVLDGRNRWRACEAAGVEPKIQPWDGECEHPALFVISKNIHRRHMTASQRALIVKRHLLPALEDEAAKRRGKRTDLSPPEEPSGKIAGKSEGEARAQAAKAAGVSPRTVSDAKSVDDQHPALGDEVLAGKKSLGQAKREIKEWDLGVQRVPMPFQKVVREIIHQNGVPESTARTIITTAMKLPTPEIEKLQKTWDDGDDYGQSYVKSRLAQVQPPADPRCVTLTTFARHLRSDAKRFDDGWSERILAMAEAAESLRSEITNWRKSNV